MALRDGVSRAGPIILEPIMRVEVVAPEDCTGDVIGDLSVRSGTIVGIGPRANGLHDITAHVPLAAMFGYATGLRSRTQGRGTYHGVRPLRPGAGRDGTGIDEALCLSIKVRRTWHVRRTLTPLLPCTLGTAFELAPRRDLETTSKSWIGR